MGRTFALRREMIMASKSAPEPEDNGVGTPAPSDEPTSPTPVVAAPSVPVLERVRRNRMGALAAGLLVAIAVGLLLSVLVPGGTNLLAYVLLGLLLTAAVGATVRYLSPDRGLAAQATAFVSTALGAHLMLITGAVNSAGSGILEDLGAAGPGFDDALLVALGAPVFSSGVLLCGLIAAVIAGWGAREDSGDRPMRPAGY